MEELTLKVKCVDYYYGYPQATREYVVEGIYMSARLNYYGNMGYDIPKITKDCGKCYGYFTSFRILLLSLFNVSRMKGIRSVIDNMREGDVVSIKLDESGEVIKK